MQANASGKKTIIDANGWSAIIARARYRWVEVYGTDGQVISQICQFCDRISQPKYAGTVGPHTHTHTHTHKLLGLSTLIHLKYTVWSNIIKADDKQPCTRNSKWKLSQLREALEALLCKMGTRTNTVTVNVSICHNKTPSQQTEWHMHMQWPHTCIQPYTRQKTKKPRTRGQRGLPCLVTNWDLSQRDICQKQGHD